MQQQVHIFGEEIIDQAAIDQLYNSIASPEDIAVLTADAHYGYNHPIGGAIAYKDKISLSGVGFDIACGNKAVKTDIKASQVDVVKVMDEIFRRISFGVGRINNEPIDHEVLERIATTSFAPQRAMVKMAAAQLGTVGSGNHFVDLFEDEAGWLWVGVHFGSRGFGHRTTTGFMALAQGLAFTDQPRQSPMHGKPLLFDVGSEIGANMRDTSVIVEGVDTPTAQKALYSTVHGAGRIMSRTKALGKTRWSKQGGKRVRTIVARGQVDFDQVREEMKDHNIYLRGGGADEAPACYKDLEEVLAYQGDTIRIKHRLHPIGVAMAGEDIYDPYKD